MRLQHQAFERFASPIGFLYQFTLRDRGLGPDPEAPVDDTDEEMQRRIKTESHVFCLGTSRADDEQGNLTLAVQCEVHDKDPAYHSEVRSALFETNLHLPTGQLHVYEYETGRAVPDFHVEPGWYRVRWYHCGFDPIKVTESGLEGTEHYLAVLWLAPPAESRFVCKKLEVEEPD
jgi:hypothetical protein